MRCAVRSIFVCLFALLCLMGDIHCHAAYPEVSAAAYVLMDADSGRVLLARDETEELPVASTTKLMTALVALRSGSLTQSCGVRPEHLVRGSSMYLAAGEELTLEQLLCGLLLASGNDAAECIADSCGGRDQFVQRMNETAAELDMMHTQFKNPSGLDETGHYSCALDLARLMAEAMREPDFARIASTKSAAAAGRSMTNHNRLLGAACGCTAGKTGYTDAAGRTLVTCAERGGLRLIAVTLRDGNDWDDHTVLYEYAFTTYRSERLIARGQTYAVAAVWGGESTFVALRAECSFSYPLAGEESVTLRIDAPETVSAPVCAGQRLGEVVLMQDGTELGRVALLAANGVREAAANAPRFLLRG